MAITGEGKGLQHLWIEKVIYDDLEVVDEVLNGLIYCGGVFACILICK